MIVLICFLLSYIILCLWFSIKDWIFYKKQKIQLQSTDKEIHDSINYNINASMSSILLNLASVVILIIFGIYEAIK